MTLEQTDSQRHLEYVALIAVKETELKEMNRELELQFKLLVQCNRAEETTPYGENYRVLRANIRELRAAIEDELLSIRLTENDLHDLEAPGWE